MWSFLAVVAVAAACLSAVSAACNCPKGQKCVLDNCVLDIKCEGQKYGPGPGSCTEKPTDPLNKPKSKLESWFTKEIFADLFPKANLGWGPVSCWPYSYEAFVIAARYFPRFGTESPDNGMSEKENFRRDLSTFFAHAVQETGENDASIYAGGKSKEEADACFYRGGFFNWFEGGPTSAFMPPASPGHNPKDGVKCNVAGRYCDSSAQSNFFYKCDDAKDGSFYKGCYFGRGAIQLSYNFNYGLFNRWLNEQGIKVDLLANPNLLMTKMDPPISIMGSMWFYMTPQPPKPAMHDIILGKWFAGDKNDAKGYKGPIFGPTSLIINNECGGEDEKDPGGPGESRRIKAFKWFTSYFGIPSKDEEFTLSCKGMPARLAQIKQMQTYGPDWKTTWKPQPCQCAPVAYGGPIPYFQKGIYPKEWVAQNAKNKAYCESILNEHPEVFGVDASSACLKSTGGNKGGENPDPDVNVKPEPPVDVKTTPKPKGPEPGPVGPGGPDKKTENGCEKDGLFRDPKDCGKYISCSGGIANKFTCPAGLKFNEAGFCDWATNVKC